MALLDDRFIFIFDHFLDALFAGSSTATKQVDGLSSSQVKEGIARWASWDGGLHIAEIWFRRLAVIKYYKLIFLLIEIKTIRHIYYCLSLVKSID